MCAPIDPGKFGEGDMTTVPQRTRLPNRRPLITETLIVGGQAIEASIGFDPATGRPRELFLTGAKDGTDLAAILDDASVVLSVALQHGVPPAALVRSVARLPVVLLAPPYLEQAGDGDQKLPASVIGAALDLVAGLDPILEPTEARS